MLGSQVAMQLTRRIMRNDWPSWKALAEAYAAEMLPRAVIPFSLVTLDPLTAAPGSVFASRDMSPAEWYGEFASGASAPPAPAPANITASPPAPVGSPPAPVAAPPAPVGSPACVGTNVIARVIPTTIDIPTTIEMCPPHVGF
jgi:hypothetical protein